MLYQFLLAPPNLEVLKQRLKNRGTETPETLKIRIEKAAYEMTFRSQFDYVVVNDVLEKAQQEIYRIIYNWLNKT